MKNNLTFMGFWAINDVLEVGRLKDQLYEMKQLGLNGVIFHPRYYPKTPEYLGQEYMDILSEVILYAKSIQMEFWIYDENGWPSGTASGKVLEANPDSSCMWLSLEGGKIQINEKKAVSSLNTKTTQSFIDITFEGYKQGLDPLAFDYVTGFFSDEVGFLDGHGASFDKGGVPWCEQFEQLYEDKYGESIMPYLSLLFVEGEGYQLIRQRYWELLTDILAKVFYEPINEWCISNGKKYTAHLKGEENPFFQVSYSGSCYQILKQVNVPAIDALERYPGNHYYPRIASSIAKQFYTGESLCEAMGGSGWGVKPETFITYMKWLVESGIKLFVLHLSQYTLNSSAIRDWPPSTPLHLNWKEGFQTAVDEVRAYAHSISGQVNDTLLVAPTRGVMKEFVPEDVKCINEHNGDFVPDTKSGRVSNGFNNLVEVCYNAGILYDVSEERMLEQYGVVNKDGLVLGNMVYKKVILGDGCEWIDTRIKDKLAEYELLISPDSIVRSTNNELLSPIMEEKNWINPCQLDYQVTEIGENQMLIDFSPLEHNQLEVFLTVEDYSHDMNLYLASTDLVDKVTVNGIELNKAMDDTVSVYALSEKIEVADTLHIIVTTKENGEENPFVFIRGRFLLKSQEEYKDMDHHQVMTKGDFVIKPFCDIHDTEDFIGQGLPFNKSVVVVEKEIELQEESKNCTLLFESVYADAIQVWVDEKDYGFSFGPEFSIHINNLVNKGKHMVKVALYPNTFNTYGPHHHIDGDRHLTSPDQYLGKKNFADHPDSPDVTLMDEWAFVKFGIGNCIKYSM